MRRAHIAFLAVLSGPLLLACGKTQNTAGTDGPVTQLDARKDSGRDTDPGVSPPDQADAAPSPTVSDAGASVADGPLPGADAAASVDGSPAPSDSGAAGGPATAERFIGEWDYSSGQARLECPGKMALTEDLAGSFLTFQAGSGAAPLLLASPDCTLRFDIKDQAAVVQPGQSCMNPVANRAATSVPTVFTFTLQGTNAAQTSTWTVTFADTPNAPCTLSGQGTLTHMP